MVTLKKGSCGFNFSVAIFSLVSLSFLQAHHHLEKLEATRVISDAPVFVFNGIKDARGEKLQKAWFSS